MADANDLGPAELRRGLLPVTSANDAWNSPDRRRRTITIVEAIIEVMKRQGRPMSADEVYQAILAADLYEFKADKPGHVVQQQIRRHCRGVDFPSASRRRIFELRGDGKYFYLQPSIDGSDGNDHRKERPLSGKVNQDSSGEVKAAYQRYIRSFRERALDAINRLKPIEFERFCRNLLVAYGFRDVRVTRVGRDGGIDGFGRLKVGFAFFNVAFQCKKWRHANVGRPEIDQFRGAIQGQYEQGIFFTTAKFTPDARNSAFKPGAVTIVLIDGPTIVDVMVEKGFGVEKESFDMYSLALDLAIAEPN